MDIIIGIGLVLSALACFQASEESDFGPLGGIAAWAIAWTVGFYLFEAGPFG